MAALWDDVGFLARETEAEAEGLEADGALLLVLGVLLVGDYGQGCDMHYAVRVGLVAVAGCCGCGGGGVDGAQGGGAGAGEDCRQRKALCRGAGSLPV